MIIKTRKAKSMVSKTKGLIGQSIIEPLYFQTRFGIHTFGMKKPIDVLILDNKNMIKSIKKGLQPARIFIWNPRYKNVLELPAGFTHDKKLTLGATIKLEIIE